MRKLCLLVCASFTLFRAANAQKPTLKDLDQKVTRILQILEEADAPPAPPKPVKIDVSQAPALGVENAPVTVVEFTDFQCPFCQRFHTETFPKLHDEFIATGKVRFVSRDLPLSMHANALHAAEAGRCAREQGHFWEMRDWMQSNPDKLESTLLRAKALDLDLDMAQFDNCLAIDKYKEDLELDVKEAQKLGITGTPAFVIGKSGSVVEGEILVGAQPLANFERAISNVKP